jgi:hypothetical protein
LFAFSTDAKCLSQFDQVEYCNVDSDNLDRYCFYPVLEFVVSDFLSNKALLLPDLYKKFEDLVDKTASQSVFSRLSESTLQYST